MYEVNSTVPMSRRHGFKESNALVSKRKFFTDQFPRIASACERLPKNTLLRSPLTRSERKSYGHEVLQSVGDLPSYRSQLWNDCSNAGAASLLERRTRDQRTKGSRYMTIPRDQCIENIYQQAERWTVVPL